MKQIAAQEGEIKLTELLKIVANGEEVIITNEDGQAFKIVSVPSEKPYPKFGSAQGMIEMSDNFDEYLEDFEEYM